MTISDEKWDDLVFDDRHKDYGAYVLRRRYPVHVTAASMIVILSFIISMVIPGLFREKQSRFEISKVKDTDYVQLKPVPTIHRINAIKPNIAGKGVPKMVKGEVGVGDKKVSVAYNQEQKPSFPGGVDALYEWLAEHLQYPSIARRLGLEGKVIVEFTVDKDGRVSNIKIIESSDKMFEDEALRAVIIMPDWTPGFVDGVKTSQKYLLPINFVLS